MKSDCHKTVQCPRCGRFYDKGNLGQNEYHKNKMCPENHKLDDFTPRDS